MLPRRLKTLRASLCVAALALAIPAQGPLAVGTRAVAWANPTTQGSLSLAATVHYPALTAGVDVPILPKPGGWPVIVFLHGYGLLGNAYAQLATAWASSGFVVVLSDTCQWDWTCQEQDGRALYSAVLVTNAASSGPFAGAFDVSRIGLAGHSMGGSSVGNILAQNPGYRSALTLAPATPLNGNASSVMVPFGIVVGEADGVTPWNGYAQPYYNAVTEHGSFKFLYLLDVAADHLNVGGLTPLPWSPLTTQVFQRCVDIGRGFFRHTLRIEATGLEAILGPAALAEPHLVSLQRETEVPQMWTDTRFHLGVSTRVSIAVEGLFAGLFASPAAISPVTTPVGVLEIDPTAAFALGVGFANPDKRVDLIVNIPADPLLVGALVAMQSLGESPVGQLTLSTPVFLNIEP